MQKQKFNGMQKNIYLDLDVYFIYQDRLHMLFAESLVELCGLLMCW